MSGFRLFRIVTLSKFVTDNATSLLCRATILNRTQTCGYAKKIVAKGKGKGLEKEELKGPEVCKDTVRLTSYAVGVNILKQGEDPKLKPPEQYPEWIFVEKNWLKMLFQLNLGTAKKLQELEPDTPEYWKRVRKEDIWRHNRLQKGKKF